MNKEKFRCHPSIIIEKTSGVITALFFIFITSLDDIKDIISEGFSGENLFIAGIVTLTLIFVLIYNIMIWSKTFITIEENTIVIQRNTLNSKVNTFGITNISNINLEQNVFERIINTYKIKIDTDSLSTADSTDIEIVLSKEEAYNFKNKVISLMNNENSTNIREDESYLEDENIDYDIVYSVNDVLKHCFYNLSFLGFMFNLAIIGFTIFISVTTDGTKGFIAIAMLIATSWISILKLFFGDFFKYYKFSIKREEDKLYISYGLFKIKKFTVPINRINAINIKQSLLSRVFNKYQSDLVTIGVGNDKTEGSQILLSSNKETFIKNMKILLPEINMEECLNLQRESKNHHIIKIVDGTMGIIICSIILYVIYKVDTTVPLIIYLFVDLLAFLYLILFYYMSYKTRGFYMGDNSMSISYGVFSKKISIIKYEKVQYINIRKNPLSTKLNLCRGELYILASLGNSIRTLGYYNPDLFEKLKEKIIKL